MILTETRTTADRLAREERRPARGEIEMRTFGVSRPAESRGGFGIDTREDGRLVLSGEASVFDHVYRVWDFEEVIRRGAFRKTLQEQKDVFAFWSHDTTQVLGRTLNGSLVLSESETGLMDEIHPPDTTLGRDVLTLVRGGYVGGQSFGFEVIKESWTQRSEQPDLREVLEVRLLEVSPCAMGANDAAWIGVGEPGLPHSDDDKRDAGVNVERAGARLALMEMEMKLTR